MNSRPDPELAVLTPSLARGDGAIVAVSAPPFPRRTVDATAESDAARAARHTFTEHERDALLVLGYLHLEQARPAEAAVLLRPLHRERPHDGEVERCLALAELASGRIEIAARLAAHAYTHAPAAVRTAMGLIYAKALWLSNDEPGAREVLLKVLARKDPCA